MTPKNPVRRRRVQIGTAVIAAVCTALSAVAVHAYAADTVDNDGADNVLTYVALGDSYSSGHGASSTYVDDACKVSDSSFPYKFIAQWQATVQPANGVNFANKACTGAKVADVIANQLSAVTDTTDIVTLSIGGNDLDFASAATKCTLQASSVCSIALDDISARLDSVTEPITNLVSEIRSIALNAKIILVGYPLIFNGSANCGTLAVSADNRNKMRTMQTTFNDNLQKIATVVSGTFNDVFYADTNHYFAGHQVCDSDRWINQVTDTVLEPTGSYHPNARGHVAMATAVLEVASGGAIIQ